MWEMSAWKKKQQSISDLVWYVGSNVHINDKDFMVFFLMEVKNGSLQ